MRIIILHAHERCEPCRDMMARFANVTAKHPKLADFCEFLHVDKLPEGATYNVVPTILVTEGEQELFKAEGRISETLLERIATDVIDGVWRPEEFRETAPSANVVFYRTYSRRTESEQRETYAEAINRVVDDISELGSFSDYEDRAVRTQALEQHALPSGRWMWVGGTKWIREPRNFSGAYNCTNTTVRDLDAFGLMMELAMMGSGTGAILEDHIIKGLPKCHNAIKITRVTDLGEKGGEATTSLQGKLDEGSMRIVVGDSRQGWVDAYQALIDLAHDPQVRPRLRSLDREDLKVVIDLSQVRPAGERLKGFGGTSNPVKLGDMFRKVAHILSAAKGRRLTPVEACLLIDEAAACIVAGNIRRSAGMRQFSFSNEAAANAKDNLYIQDKEGNWKVDPVRESLRMANHTRVAHKKPTLEQVKQAVSKQYFSGEGAIQYAPEAIARANADLLQGDGDKEAFIEMYEQGFARDFLCSLIDVDRPDMDKEEKNRELDHRMMRYGLNPCGEIIGEDFHCNLAEVHLNTIDPKNVDAQILAFQAAGLQVAALLHHDFRHERYAYSRDLDPIVGVSFTGLFDFFVHAFGIAWLDWMMEGRPDTQFGREMIAQERGYLGIWKRTVGDTVKRYCFDHDVRLPNRCTTVQPAGTKSLLTGASSGWHPPKSQRFIRRITVGANDPVALAAIDYGYSVIPAQSARDEEGNLLDNINDHRVQEWLIEIPTEVSWANIEGVDRHDLANLPAAAQFGLYMQVQNFYTEHNTSATIEFREDEIDELSELIHDHMGKGYISAALLQRFDASGGTFPRLPFEPISKETYDELAERVAIKGNGADFHQALRLHDSPNYELETSSACTSASCLAAADKASRTMNL